MKLERPLIFFDLETTGVAISEDRIVDVAFVRRGPDGKEETFSSLVDPGVPIPAEASAIHHITDDMVQDAPTFKALAPKLLEFIGDADFGGFNVVRFDLPMLDAEFRRAGYALDMKGRRVVDAFTIFQRMEPRNLAAAYKMFCGKEISNAHRAEADAKASFEVFWAQLERYSQLPKDIDGLSAFCQEKNAAHVDRQGKFVWRNGKASFNFGKHRTRSIEDVARTEPSYLEWLAGASQTTPELARICKEALAGKFPVKPK